MWIPITPPNSSPTVGILNIGGLPWIQDPHGFWWCMLLMLATLVTAFTVLKRQQFF